MHPTVLVVVSEHTVGRHAPFKSLRHSSACCRFVLVHVKSDRGCISEVDAAREGSETSRCRLEHLDCSAHHHQPLSASHIYSSTWHSSERRSSIWAASSTSRTSAITLSGRSSRTMSQNGMHDPITDSIVYTALRTYNGFKASRAR